MNRAAFKSRDWESVFSTWANGPSDTEHIKAENAERLVSTAIRDSDRLQHRNIKIFTQGSYRNRVNVRRDSDVDIGVICFNSYFSDYTDDNVKGQVQKFETPARYTYSEFKNELHQTLIDYFGHRSITRGDKAFQVDANTYRVNADVATFFEHRRYYSATNYYSGVEMQADEGKRIVNWPEQHYKSGVLKNKRTRKRFKRCVRILKTLRNEMSDNGIFAANVVPSFLIECLVWNASNSSFDNRSCKSMMRAVLANLYNDTRTDDKCREWTEVSELKYLFRYTQPWTRENANAFISAAWNYIGFDDAD